MPTEEIILTSQEAAELAEELQTQIQTGEISKSNENQIKLMIAGLGDSRGLLRRTFAEGLGKVGKAALPGLSKALLFSKNVTVRRAAAKTLKLVGDPAAVPFLLQALTNDKDPVVQGSSAGAIAIFGEEAVEPLIEVLINPKSTSMQCGLATWGLAFIGAEAPNALKKAAHSKNEKIRSAAIAALGEQIQCLGDKEARHLLLNALDDPSIEVRVEATKLIGRLYKKSWGETALINKLNDTEGIVRKHAALSLMNINAIDSLSYIKKKISEEKDNEVIRILKLAINQLNKKN